MASIQNVWELQGVLLNRQKRRSQVVKKCITANIKKVLDIGCAEGFATKYIIDDSNFVVGVELNFEHLRIAKDKIKDGFFINASIDYLPFKDRYFDGITILEVLEHLPSELQKKGLKEANRVLNSNGVLIISVPYKEQILYTNCIHCNKDTPLYGHLHSLDENKISAILPNNSFKMIAKYNLPNMVIVSCSNLMTLLPLSLWIKFNNFLGRFKIQKGYWIILKYDKL